MASTEPTAPVPSDQPSGGVVTADSDIIRAEHISKNFGPVRALRDINIHVGKGEVVALLGDNGAGKSTLIKILTGFHQPDTGQIYFDGQPVSLNTVSQARSMGIETVFQDLALVDDLPVYLNLHLNAEPLIPGLPFINRGKMRRKARQALDSIGINIPSVDATVRRMSGGQRQAIAVARSVFGDAKLLLLDEPLAAMGAKESAVILDLISEVRSRGDVGILIIAHNYGQVLDICDRVNLLQHGEITLDKAARETSVDELTELVVAEYREALAEKRRAENRS